MTSRMLTRSPRLQPGMAFLRRVTRRPLRNRLQQRLLQATYLRLAKALPRQRSRALPPLEEMLARESGEGTSPGALLRQIVHAVMEGDVETTSSLPL